LTGLTALPALAGQRTVGENLVQALVRLAELRERLIPLEIAVLNDPELAAQRQASAGSTQGRSAICGRDVRVEAETVRGVEAPLELL
jgi:hypothetical protein